MQIPDFVHKAARDAGWEINDETTVTCPHGHRIEWDGTCPEGCVSIIRQMGLI